MLAVVPVVEAVPAVVAEVLPVVEVVLEALVELSEAEGSVVPEVEVVLPLEGSVGGAPCVHSAGI